MGDSITNKFGKTFLQDNQWPTVDECYADNLMKWNHRHAIISTLVSA
jgi:hypothetical protein